MPNETPENTHQYPVNLELSGRHVLLVGAGKVGAQKIKSMLGAGAHVTVVAPVIHETIRRYASDLRHGTGVATIELIERPYRTGDIADQWLVLTCTDDRAVNRQVFLDAEAAGVWSNSADDPQNCAWTLPSVVRQGDLQLTISTRGKSPALSMWMRKRFEREIDERWTDLLAVLADVRAEARATRGTSEIKGWTEALDCGAFDLAMAGDLRGARHCLRSELGLIGHDTGSEPDQGVAA